jgi:pimeloyl-ACP methyl ester carboxylesterase
MQKIIKFIVTKLLGLYINLLSYTSPKKASKLAYKFFSEPRSGRLLKDHLPDILKEAETEVISFKDDIFQTYTWRGTTNCKVILVHGWESNASRWKLFITYLKKAGCTIIAIDGPAHGLSSGKEFTIPRYAEFIDIIVQREQPQFMVGHSLGGSTVLYYQSHFTINNSLEKLVVMGAPCDFTMVVNNYIGLLSLNKNVFGLLNKHFLDNLNIKTAEFSGRLFAAKIKVEGLVAHDEDDTTVSYGEGIKIAEAWEQSQFVTTKGLGHSMHSDELYTKIYSFLFSD